MIVKREERFGTHTHTFTRRQMDLSAEYCTCGAVLISNEEYDRRVAEWDSYFEIVATTESYRDYQEMTIAFKNNDRPQIAEVLARVKQRVEQVDDGVTPDENWRYHKMDYLAKPDFPDPRTWGRYVVRK